MIFSIISFAYFLFLQQNTSVPVMATAVPCVIWCHGKFRIKSARNDFKQNAPANGNFQFQLTSEIENARGWVDECVQRSRSRQPRKCSTQTKNDNGLSVYRIAILSSFITAYLLLETRSSETRGESNRAHLTCWLLALPKPKPEEFSLSIAHRYRIIYGFNVAIIFTVCVRRILPSMPPSLPPSPPSLLLFPFFSSPIFICRSIVADALSRHCCHCFCFRRVRFTKMKIIK